MSLHTGSRGVGGIAVECHEKGCHLCLFSVGADKNPPKDRLDLSEFQSRSFQKLFYNLYKAAVCSNLLQLVKRGSFSFFLF